VNQIYTRHSKYRRSNDYDAQILRKTRKVELEALSLSEYTVPVTIDRQLKDRQQAKIVRSNNRPRPESTAKKTQNTSSEECKNDSLYDQNGDDIIRKLSTCLAFYGNFVIIFDVKDTLDHIEKNLKNVKLNYWHEIMAFIDSYDLPYTNRSEKMLINKLINEITKVYHSTTGEN
jgi:hypothetical protein